ncbi:C10 family peptidase [bacterium]|nr:C10 family peptidase [bacterium]
MKNTFFISIILAGCLLSLVTASAQRVTSRQAGTVARSWIETILMHEGDWGGQPAATVSIPDPIIMNDDTVGFYCPVLPAGYIVVSSVRTAAPVKAWSESGGLDFSTPQGFASLLAGKLTTRLKLDRYIQQEQQRLGKEAATGYQEYLQRCGTMWDALLSGRSALLAYDAGAEPLLTSRWDQDYPYNAFCPTENGMHKKAGCVAIAAGQIMRYWNWPPEGEGSDGSAGFSDPYLWCAMLDGYDGNGISNEQIDAVAELCYEVGKAAGTDYGLEMSTAYLGGHPGATDMTEAYREHFRYNENTDFEIKKPDLHVFDGRSWFEIIQDNINANMPVQYGFTSYDLDLLWVPNFKSASHSMVCDGWKIVGSTEMVHMNYGWGGANDDWYTIDDLPLRDYGGSFLEFDGTMDSMIRKIRPAPCFPEGILDRTYGCLDYPYRYFHVNASGWADFEEGQRFQFLPEISVTCTNSLGIIFRESSLLFTRGDQTKGIQTFAGSIKIAEGGVVKLY